MYLPDTLELTEPAHYSYRISQNIIEYTRNNRACKLFLSNIQGYYPMP